MEHSPDRVFHSSNVPIAIRSQGGMSLIAVIGVLAVVTIGLSLGAPAMVKILDLRHGDTEVQHLREIAEGLHMYLEQNKSFTPSLASLSPDFVPLASAQITHNSRGYARYYVVHPNASSFDDAAGFTAGALADARFLLISNLTQDEAPTITNASEFETWWTTDESATPELKIFRGNIGYLFHQLTIEQDGNGGSYQLNGTATNSGGGPLATHTSYHLSGTSIQFDEADTYSSPEVQFALTTNTTYWFDPNCTVGKQWNPITPNCLGPIVLYTFEEGAGTTVNDVSGVGSPLNLTVANGAATNWVSGGLSINSSTIIESSGAATKVINAVTASNAITIEAWVKPANITQAGPARIVTLSQNTSNRNFTMGQGYYGSNPTDVFDFRLRTTTQSNNGLPSITSPSGTATTMLTHIVNTRDASGTANIYVNGVLQTSGTFGGDLSNWNTTYKLGLANELTLDRPWLGELHLVAIYDTALSQSQVSQRYAAGGGVTFRDEFNTIAYNGNDGTQNYSNDWQEIGESNGPGNDIVGVSTGSECAAGSCLQWRGEDDEDFNGVGLSREVDLSGQTTATLTYSYRRERVDEPPDPGSITLAVSSNGGTSWTNLQTYVMTAEDGSHIPQSFDITAYMASNTQIRFIGTVSNVDRVRFYIDNVEIAAN